MTTEKKVKIAIVGSREYTNRRKIKDVVFKLKQRFGERLEIVSGGQPKGADGYAKKAAIELEVKYVEFPPYHYQHNQHCILESARYGKPYKVWHFFTRNKQIAEYCDYMFAFLPNGIVKGGTANALKHAEDFEKKTVIFD